MANVLIVYGSTMGNTEIAANMIADVIRGAGNSAIVLNAANVDCNGLCAGFDCVLFGSSTWGDGQLQDNFSVLYDCFDNLGVTGVKSAAFGCGDSGYPTFCGAVDIIHSALEEYDAKIVAPALKIDGEPQAAKGEIEAWAAAVAKAI